MSALAGERTCVYAGADPGALCVCVCACVRACVRACVCVCVHVYVRSHVPPPNFCQLFFFWGLPMYFRVRTLKK